jgi:hypothetical protein
MKLSFYEIRRRFQRCGLKVTPQRVAITGHSPTRRPMPLSKPSIAKLKSSDRSRKIGVVYLGSKGGGGWFTR